MQDEGIVIRTTANTRCLSVLRVVTGRTRWAASGPDEGLCHIASAAAALAWEASYVRLVERAAAAAVAAAAVAVGVSFVLGASGLWGEWLYGTFTAVCVSYALLLKVVHTYSMQVFKQDLTGTLRAKMPGYAWEVRGMSFVGEHAVPSALAPGMFELDAVGRQRGGLLGVGSGGAHLSTAPSDSSLQQAAGAAAATSPGRDRNLSETVVEACGCCNAPFRTDRRCPALTCDACAV